MVPRIILRLVSFSGIVLGRRLCFFYYTAILAGYAKANAKVLKFDLRAGKPLIHEESKA
jgi:hypothetical protein